MKQMSGWHMPRDGSAVKAGSVCTLQRPAPCWAKKVPPKMRYSRWSRADLVFMDLPMTQNSNPIGATRRPTRPCACWAPAIWDAPAWGAFDTQKWPYGCEKIRSCCAVTIVSGTVPRFVGTFRRGPAPKQARPAGTQGRQAPEAGRQRQTSMSRKKDTQTPTHPNAAHPDTRRQNSWFQISTF